MASLNQSRNGTTIFVFSIKSKESETCAAAISNGKVAGKKLYFFLKPIEEDAVEHLLQCTEFGSELTLGGNALDYNAESELELTGTNAGDLWASAEGT